MSSYQYPLIIIGYISLYLQREGLGVPAMSDMIVLLSQMWHNCVYVAIGFGEHRMVLVTKTSSSYCVCMRFGFFFSFPVIHFIKYIRISILNRNSILDGKELQIILQIENLGLRRFSWYAPGSLWQLEVESRFSGSMSQKIVRILLWVSTFNAVKNI